MCVACQIKVTKSMTGFWVEGKKQKMIQNAERLGDTYMD